MTSCSVSIDTMEDVLKINLSDEQRVLPIFRHFQAVGLIDSYEVVSKGSPKNKIVKVQRFKNPKQTQADDE